MSKRTTWLVGLSTIVAAAWTLTAQQPARQVDDAALKDAAKNPNEWVEYNGGWMEQRYSALKQIDDSNAGRLGLAWYADIPSAPAGGHTSAQDRPRGSW